MQISQTVVLLASSVATLRSSFGNSIQQFKMQKSKFNSQTVLLTFALRSFRLLTSYIILLEHTRFTHSQSGPVILIHALLY